MSSRIALITLTTLIIFVIGLDSTLFDGILGMCRVNAMVVMFPAPLWTYMDNLITEAQKSKKSQNKMMKFAQSLKVFQTIIESRVPGLGENQFPTVRSTPSPPQKKENLP